MNQLVAFLVVHEIRKALSPSVLKVNKYFNQLNVIFELRVNNLDVLLVLLE